MPLIQYVKTKFGPERSAIISRVNDLIADYSSQGYTLTLRQLYYQFVARGWIANKQREYKRLGDIVNDGRLAGLVDWYAIEDRTRNLGGNSHWTDPGKIIESAAHSYMIDKWEDQPYRIEVWVEKDALEGVVGQAARSLDINYFSCRGYTSQTSMWDAGRRLMRYAEKGQEIIVLHLGDHDPSGIDMSRDIQDRLRMFMGDKEWALQFERIALNADQINRYNPPPNPAKITDSRYAKYQAKFGEESWELDALEPKVITQLITRAVARSRHDQKYKEQVSREKTGKQLLTAAARRWTDVAAFLEA